MSGWLEGRWRYAATPSTQREGNGGMGRGKVERVKGNIQERKQVGSSEREEARERDKERARWGRLKEIGEKVTELENKRTNEVQKGGKENTLKEAGRRKKEIGRRLK